MGDKVISTPTGAILEHPGSGMAYSSYKCRCDECKAFNTQRNAIRREERRKIGATGVLPDGVEHGKSAASNWGCKCEVCIEATRVSNERYYSAHHERVGRPRGESHWSSKLKELEVMAIHSRLELGEKVSMLAKEYGVNRRIIGNIKSGRTWGWLTGRGNDEDSN